MKENRITRAVDIFLDALNNGSLKFMECSHCAVGSLVANGLNIQCGIESSLWMQSWSYFKQTLTKELSPIQIKCIESTEFSQYELMRIERAFMLVYEDEDHNNTIKSQIKGLEAVVKVMLTFEDSKQDVKEIFTNKAELIAI